MKHAEMNAVETAIASVKASAAILIVGHGKNDRTEIRTNRLLSGDGIKRLRIVDGMATYLVNEAVMVELRRRYIVKTDF